MSANKLIKGDADVGDVLTLFTEKNKIAPRHRRITLTFIELGALTCYLG